MSNDTKEFLRFLVEGFCIGVLFIVLLALAALAGLLAVKEVIG